MNPTTIIDLISINDDYPTTYEPASLIVRVCDAHGIKVQKLREADGDYFFLTVITYSRDTTKWPNMWLRAGTRTLPEIINEIINLHALGEASCRSDAQVRS